MGRSCAFGQRSVFSGAFRVENETPSEFIWILLHLFFLFFYFLTPTSFSVSRGAHPRSMTLPPPCSSMGMAFCARRGALGLGQTRPSKVGVRSHPIAAASPTRLGSKLQTVQLFVDVFILSNDFVLVQLKVTRPDHLLQVKLIYTTLSQIKLTKCFTLKHNPLKKGLAHKKMQELLTKSLTSADFKKTHVCVSLMLVCVEGLFTSW